MHFHSRWGKKTYLKAQKCSKFHRRDLLHDHVFELIMTQKRKRELFPTNFEVNLSAVILSIVLRADFNFELVLYITIVVFLTPRSFYKSAICSQNSLESAAIVLFSAQSKEAKNYSPERFESFIHVDLPFWGHPNIYLCFFLSILSAREVICRF